MKNLVLHVKRCYFEDMKAGRKVWEYRLTTPYWRKRLEGRYYSCILICDGYPKHIETERRLIAPWLGYEVQTITHPHFGADPVEVFAIRVHPI